MGRLVATIPYTVESLDTADILNEWKGFIHSVARRLTSIARYLSRTAIDYDDLISVGRIGVIEAYEKHDSNKIPLRPFVKLRIRYRMIDEIRRLCFYNRKEMKIHKVSYENADIYDVKRDFYEFIDDMLEDLEIVPKQERSLQWRINRLALESGLQHLSYSQKYSIEGVLFRGETDEQISKVLKLSKRRVRQLRDEGITQLIKYIGNGYSFVKANQRNI